MREVTCPQCQLRFKVQDLAADAYAPFCSQRCRDLDLGNWLNERYSVPVETERVARMMHREGEEYDPFAAGE
ncbi:DNA gyrase inhibitor [Planctomycetes bacterium Pan216]|uniref:DNA gyrase inhibitor n=1 Tax=Kolteria novifilia TaxID=2527975 RepID=A0A518B126_9BACT|nr:DNA gyrase inhibitor [Planctomycetes bacterium Pan216]